MKNTCQQEYKYRDLFFYMAITALAIYTIAAVANTTIIFADGSGVCVSMLSDKSWYLYDEVRKYGLIIRQIFAIAYLKISDMPQALIFIRLLAFGYAFWNSFFYALAVCICKKRKNDILLYFTFALFTLFFVDLTLYLKQEWQQQLSGSCSYFTPKKKSFIQDGK